MRHHQHYVGLDVGLDRDFSGLCVIRRGPAPLPEEPPRLDVVDLQRVRDVTFVGLAREVRRLVDHIGGAAVAVDVTGIGRGAWEEMRRVGMRPIGVTIGGGSKITGGPLRWNVPHPMLYETIYSTFVAGRYRIAEGLPLAEALIRELQLVQARRTDRGAVHYEVQRGVEGHGDMTVALALATLLAEREVSRTMARHRATTRPEERERPQGKPRQRGSLAQRVLKQRLDESEREALEYRARELERFRAHGFGT